MNNVYQRPLFMQQGGSTRPMLPSPPQGMMGRAAPPMAPPMPRQAMAPPMPRPQAPPMAPPGPRPAGPMAPPGGGAPDMAGIASMISQKAKADISQAQGPEEIINAFRGNQRPLQARYQELAQYVGPQDATATPVSVLTMIQPSLMMTADGAAQSGIGELMAGITSDVAMEEAPGVPSRMGQGVGELMMAGQPPQPAGMAHGGIVKKFREGGSSLRDYYNEDLATYQDIMAPTDADRRTAKQSMLMDISSRALANAGGAGADKNIAGQVADIFQTLPSNYANYQNQLRQGETATRQAALESASGRVAADRATAIKRAELLYEQGLLDKSDMQKFIYDSTINAQEADTDAIAAQAEVDARIAEANAEDERKVEAARLLAKAELGSTTPIMAQWFDKNGVVLSSAFNIADPDELAKAQALGNNSPFIGAALLEAKDVDSFAPAPSSARGTTKPVRLIMLDGTFRTFNEADPTTSAEYMQAVAEGGLVMVSDVAEEELGSPTAAALSTQIAVLQEGKRLSPVSQANLVNALQTYDKDRTVVTEDPVTGIQSTSTYPGTPIPDNFVRIIQAAIEAGNFDADGLPPKYRKQPQAGVVLPVSQPVVQEQALNDMLATETAPVQQATVQTNETPIPGQVSLREVPGMAEVASAGSDYSDLDFSLITSTPEAVKNIAGNLATALVQMIPGDYPGVEGITQGSEQEIELRSRVENLGTDIMTKFMSTRAGKSAQDERDALRKLIPMPNEIFSNLTSHKERYASIMTTFAKNAQADKDYLENTSIRKNPTLINEAVQSYNINAEMYETLRSVVSSLERTTSGGTNNTSVSGEEVGSMQQRAAEQARRRQDARAAAGL